MNCLREEILQRYLDNELSPAASADVTAHLADCSTCQAQKHELDKVWMAINEALSSDLPEVAPTARLFAHLESSLREERARTSVLTPFLNWRLTAAAAAAILLLLFATISRLATRLQNDSPSAAPTAAGRPDSPNTPTPAEQSDGKVVARRSKTQGKSDPRRDFASSPEETEATRFYSLVDENELAPLESGRIVRVEVPASTLISFGLPITTEAGTQPVQADLLLGQDGLARAIRFVPAGQTDKLQ